jgi:hypothetical protein
MRRGPTRQDEGPGHHEDEAGEKKTSHVLLQKIG